MSMEESPQFFRNRAHHVSFVSFLLFLTTLGQLAYNVILVLRFDTTMAVFQASWVHFSIIALVSLFAVIIFGFYAISANSDRQASIFKSWILFFTITLFFCGFFHIIAIVRDDSIFYAQCSRGFHGSKDDREIVPDATAVHSHDFCRKVRMSLTVVNDAAS